MKPSFLLNASLLAVAAIAAACGAPSDQADQPGKGSSAENPEGASSAASPPPSPLDDEPVHTEIVNGLPINSGGYTLSFKFPYSTVFLSYLDTVANIVHSCTGVILSSTQILTAAHCQVGQAGTLWNVAYYSNTKSTPCCGFVSTVAGPAAVQSNVTGAASALSNLTGDGLTNSNGDLADIAVATLVNPIPTTYPYVAVTLLPSGTYASANVYKNPSYAVGTGFMNGKPNNANTMEWVVAILSSTNDNGGWFQTKNNYTDVGDSGGPIFQEALDGSGGLILVGINSGTYWPYTLNQYRFTSVSTASNYSWIQSQIIP